MFPPLLYLPAKWITSAVSFPWHPRGSRWRQSGSKLGSGQKSDKLPADTFDLADEYLPRTAKYETLSPPRGGWGRAVINSTAGGGGWPHTIARKRPRPRTARHADAASGLGGVRLPPQCDSKQTQNNEIHCREPVGSTLGARRRGRDSHTVSCSQSVNK